MPEGALLGSRNYEFQTRSARLIRNLSNHTPATEALGAPLTKKSIEHFTVVAKLPGLRMEARLPVTLF